MKHGAFNMILKANDKVCSGSGHHPHDPSLHVKSHEWRPLTFFDIKGIVHFKFILWGQTVNQAYYVEIMKWLHEAVCRKRPELGSTIEFSTITVL